MVLGVRQNLGEMILELRNFGVNRDKMVRLGWLGEQRQDGTFFDDLKRLWTSLFLEVNISNKGT